MQLTTTHQEIHIQELPALAMTDMEKVRQESRSRTNQSSSINLLKLFTLLSTLSLAQASISNDGLCPLFVFVPFTDNGTAALTMPTDPYTADYPGLSYTASALMAIQHFNDRNPVVVPQLTNYTRNCSVKFDTNNTRIIDTGSTTHLAATSIWEARTTPCAMAGTFNDLPASQVATMAHASSVPFVVSAADNAHIFGGESHPFTAQVFPDTESSTRSLRQFLLSKGRTNYISYFYAISDTNIQRQEQLAYDFDLAGIDSFFQPFVNDQHPLGQGVRSIEHGLAQVKERGFRTIVVSFDNAVIEGIEIARVAENLGMNNGEYLWVFFGKLRPNLIFSFDRLVAKFLKGSVWVIPMENYLYKPDSDPFSLAWQQQSASMTELVNDASPLDSTSPAYSVILPNFFQKNPPDYGSAFLYDSIMSIGIGACIAEEETRLGLIQQEEEEESIENDLLATSTVHLKGIRAVNFTGATGNISFGDVASLGARTKGTVVWGALNVIKLPTRPGEAIEYSFTDVRESNESDWEVLKPIVYANGSNTPPILLRDQPNMNYLHKPVRAVGFALMGSVILCALITHIGVFVMREHRVVRAAQPLFMHLLAIGATISALAILPLSYDESYGLDQDGLDRACMSIPWLTTIGTIITYGALFSKLWRVERVLQFTRRKITTKHVIWPIGLLLLGSVTVLTMWTIMDSLRWDRVILDESTGESIGLCSCDNIGAFLGPLIAFILVPLILSAVMARKTSDVDEDFSEGYWIFVLLVIQLEVILIAAPIVVILRDVSTDGRFFGFVIMLWIFPMSTLGIIVAPKLSSCIRNCADATSGLPKRGERSSEIRVTGLDNKRSKRSNVSSTAEERSIALQGISQNSESNPQ